MSCGDLISTVTYYSVKRHSLQALLKTAANMSIHDTPVIRGMSADSAAANANLCGRGHLDLECGASQTRTMAHSYIKLDFGTDEEKAQQARHKLDGWKQAFRLDKRLLYKLDRPESDAGEVGSKPEPVEKPAPAAKSQAKTAANPKAKTAAKASKPAAEKSASATNGKVALLVRLYFSSHEKLSEQRWLERIPSEEPFKSASPKVVHHSDPEFESTDQKFEALE